MNLFEFFIGFRYLKAKKAQGLMSFNTVLSIVIVFIGVFTLIVVISIFSGFQSAIKDKILDVNSHLFLINYPMQREKGIRNYDRLKNRIGSIKGIKSVEPYIDSQALFRYRDNISTVMVRGMGTEKIFPEDFKKYIVKGENRYKGKNSVYIGTEMADNYNIRIGDKIELIVPKGKLTLKTGTGIDAGKGTFTVTGMFKTHYYEYDTSLIVMSLKSAQELYEIGDVVSGIGMKIYDIYRMDQIARNVQVEIGYDEFQIMTAEEKNSNFFYALRLEKLSMVIILFLVIISAMFTIMGTMVMVVTEKRRAIGILKSIGARPRSIMTIFVMEGFLIGFIGSLAGVILGLAASINLESIIQWVENTINTTMSFIYHLFSLGIFEKVTLVPKNVYYLDRIPTEISIEFVVTIAILTVFLSTLAAIFPSWHASRLQPIETIRYE